MANKNYMCPVRMSDGRIITDYRPKSTVNYELIEEVAQHNLPKSSYETRMYLQSNASTIMENETKKSFENLMPYKKCKGSVESNTELPQKYIVSCDAVSCSKKLFDQNGLGDGYTTDTSVTSYPLLQ
jgi:hypothetical protein|tara:strand:- start:18298 stop:18678 length:381 start_codon:yes stop_codon:yes gene_type:complete